MRDRRPVPFQTAWVSIGRKGARGPQPGRGSTNPGIAGRETRTRRVTPQGHCGSFDLPSSDLPTGRDSRVDLLRGLALLFIFIDHIPGNRLSAFTLRGFGFCDAADLFVFLAGFSATLAYGRVFERAGFGVGLAKVLARCGTVYGVQVALLATTAGLAALWVHLGGAADPNTAMLLDRQGLIRGLLLQTLPLHLDILPL